jgi:hypothetical protein
LLEKEQRMHWFKRLLAAGIMLVLIGSFLTQVAPRGTTTVSAAFLTPTPHPKKRITKLTVQYTRYEWWMIRWSTNKIDCQLFIDHPGLPTNPEIFKQCSARAFGHWEQSLTCPQAGNPADSDACAGSYMHLANIDDSSHEVEVELPLPKVWLSLVGCNPIEEKHACTSVPSLLLEGEEPLPNEAIIQIQGTLNGQPFTCQGGQCTLPLNATGVQGAKMEFWADSSLGDSSERFSAMVRVMPWGDFMNPEGGATDPALWYVDVLSSQWRGGSVDTCANSWQAFPDLGGPPDWLRTPEKVEDLQTKQLYYLLAGSLIQNGAVDVSQCSDGGMSSKTVPSTCGLEKAQPKVIEWQNLFDGEILNAAQETGVPAFLIKSVFSRESQFWPGTFSNYKEAGLGQLTENGADTVLLWNPDFFAQFCVLILDKSVCQVGFGNLNNENQRLLRGALVSKVNASCADCAMGIDLTRANFSVRVFAESLLANCEQTAQIIYNLTRKPAGQVSSYVDLWRFTVLNYNAGPGCLYTALQSSMSLGGGKINWSQMVGQLEPVCQSGITYLEDISQEILPTPFVTATATLEPSETPTPTSITDYSPSATPETPTPTSPPDSAHPP